MKKYALYALLAAIIFATGCKKNDGGGGNDYFIRFKANGNQKTYTSDIGLAAFHGLSASGTYNCQLRGKQDAASDNNFITLNLVSAGPYVINKTYDLQNVVPLSGSSGGAIELNVTYTHLDGVIYLALLQRASYTGINIKDEASLIFTEITDKYVKGTFSAKTYKSLTGGGSIENREEMLITDGEFYLPRQNF